MPFGKVLVHDNYIPVYEYDPHPHGDPSGYISYYSYRQTVVYEAGQLAPIECFEKGIIIGHGETAEYADERYDEYYIVFNAMGKAVFEDCDEN